MIERNRVFGCLLAMLLGASLAGCGDTPPPAAVPDKSEGSLEKGKMGGPMESGKMESGKMESGKMESGKMGGAMEPGKMEGSPK